jgi:hypothetical protein
MPLLQSLQTFSFVEANEAMSFSDDAASGKSEVLSRFEPRQDRPEQHQRQKERGGEGEAEAGCAEYHTKRSLTSRCWLWRWIAAGAMTSAAASATRNSARKCSCRSPGESMWSKPSVEHRDQLETEERLDAGQHHAAFLEHVRGRGVELHRLFFSGAERLGDSHHGPRCNFRA